MVTFTCSTCGDSIRKNAVEKHSFRCRFSVMTCIDCFKEFTRSSYATHNQCMTENERYQGKLYAGKGSENKGQKRQDNWLQNIQAYVDSGKAGPVTSLVEKLLAYPNIPRKKNKFGNFVNNCMSLRNAADVDRMWSVIVEANQRNVEQEPQADLPDKVSVQSNGTKRQISEDQKQAVDQKKRKGVSEENEKDSNLQSDASDKVPCSPGNVSDRQTDRHVSDLREEAKDNDKVNSCDQKFHWKKTIKRLVKAHGGEGMLLKDLKRQVYALYKESIPKSSRLKKVDVHECVANYVSKSRSLQVCGEIVSLMDRSSS